ncbi:MAG: hypothetical protein AAF639_01165 [Chloroflexota bacterium]
MTENTYTFGQCTRLDLEKWFGLRRTWSSTLLDGWLNTQVTLTEKEKIVLNVFQEGLILGHDAWSEQELSMNFIGPVLKVANFIEPYRFNLFAGRKIGTTVPALDGEIELSGNPDGLIATGYWEPEIPMFAFSEYKRTLDPNGDPAGQTLAAMLVGQVLNKDETPLYGCYVVGHYWHFLVLEGKSYAISQDYSALTDDIFDILRILKALKNRLMARTQPPSHKNA